MAAIDNDVRGHLFEVVQGRLGVDAFEDWFVSAAWDERSPLVRRVEHLLVMRADLSQTELYELLRNLMSTIEVEAESRLHVTTATLMTTFRSEVALDGNQTIIRRMQLAGT